MKSRVTGASEEAKKEACRAVLNGLAVIADPNRGDLKNLAFAIGRNENTLYQWRKKGWVPSHAAKHLEDRYGPEKAPARVMSWR